MRCRVFLIAMCLFLGWALAACRHASPGPKLEYQADPAVLVIGTDSLTIPVPLPGEMCNYIPDLRVWGDGRVVYSHFQDGKRVVQAGSLDAAQIHSLLQTLAEAGFFRNNTPNQANPAGIYFSLVVNLKSGLYHYTWNFPPDIYSVLSSRVAGLDVPEYTPDRALLVSTPCSSAYCPRVDALPEWPDRFGFLLADAEHGGWISGDALSFVWQAVNTTFPVPGFREGKVDYGIVLEIPGVSWSDPPFDCWGSLKSIVH